MKRVIGTFFNDTEEAFHSFVEIFENAGYEVAQQGGIYQAVVITDEPEPTPDEEPDTIGE